MLGWYFAIDESLPCPKPGYTCVFHHTSPVKADTDGEGCTDYWEYRNNYDPLDRSQPPASWVPTLCTLPPNGNYPPIIYDKAITISRGAQVIIPLGGDDLDNDRLTFKIVSPPNIGTVTSPISTGPNSAQTTFTSKPGYTGLVTFTFKSNDGKVDTPKTGTVAVTVTRLRQLSR